MAESISPIRAAVREDCAVVNLVAQVLRSPPPPAVPSMNELCEVGPTTVSMNARQLPSVARPQHQQASVVPVAHRPIPTKKNRALKNQNNIQPTSESTDVGSAHPAVAAVEGATLAIERVPADFGPDCQVGACVPFQSKRRIVVRSRPGSIHVYPFSVVVGDPFPVAIMSTA